MKRCNRHLYPSHNPYAEFHFEESLRKYEVCPKKKIKLRSFVCFHAANHGVVEETTMNLNIKSTKREEQQLSSKGEDAEANLKCENPDSKAFPKENFKENKLQAQEESSILKKQDEERRQNSVGVIEAPEEQESLKAKQPPKYEIFNLDKDYFSLLNQDKKEILAEEVEHLRHSDHIYQSAMISSEVLEPQTHRQQERPKGGRLNLTGTVSISLRRLSKHREKGSTQAQLLEELIKQRSYLEAQRTEIANRLRGFLQHN